MQKIALDLGFWAIHWYGVLVAVGFMVGLWTAGRRGLRIEIPAESILNLGPWLIGGVILGARTWFVVFYWKLYFAQEPWWEIFMIQHGGLVFYGGLAGATVTVILYARFTGLPLWQIADVLAPSVALGHAFGRMGCLMNGCCYGYPTDLPWGILFPAAHETHGLRVHPTQLYDAGLALVLYLVLAGKFRHKRFPGQIFAIYLMAYAMLRSLTECFRGDYTVFYWGGLTSGQVVSFGVFAAGLVLYVVLRHPAAPSFAEKP